MYSTRSSKLQKTSKKAQKTPIPHEDVIQRRVRRNRRTGLRQAWTGDCIIVTDAGTDRDLFDIIDGKQDTEDVILEDDGKPLEVVDEEVTESVDGDQSSVSCLSIGSTASGPTFLHTDLPMKQSPPRVRCSGCQKLYQKAKKMKAPLKGKLLDNDPTSLTCDQWVLKKKWRPSRPHNVKGKLWTHLKLVKKRLGEKKSEQCVGEIDQSACSRPHTFLQRNLRQCVKMLAKRGRKKARRKGKRTREDTEDPRLAKQRLHNTSLQRYSDSNSINDSSNHLYLSDCYSSTSAFEGCSEQWDPDQPDAHLIVEVSPSSVTMETTEPTEAPPKKKVPERRRGFRDLLVQLRGNSSMIVREKS